MVEDSTLQIFLTLYYGSIITTFFYDYIVRNLVDLILTGQPQWAFITNIVLGVVFIAVCIWAAMSVRSKIRSNLMLSLLVLIIILVVRLAIGIPQHILRDGGFDVLGRDRRSKEGLIIWVIQIVTHVFGIVATWILAQRST